MEPAEAFDRDDAAIAQNMDAFFQRLLAFYPELRTPNSELYFRSTCGARVRLRVESPVFWVFIFRQTFRAHGEACHGSIRPVVRNRPCYGIAGAAVRTIDEGIEEPPVAGIKQLLQTVLADRDVGRNKREQPRLRAVRAFVYGEIRISFVRKRGYGEIGDQGERRRRSEEHTSE